MKLYDLVKLNKERRFKSLLKENERELKRAIKENIKEGFSKFTFSARYTSGREEESEIYSALMHGILAKDKYKEIYSRLDWYGFGKSHLRLSLEIIEIKEV